MTPDGSKPMPNKRYYDVLSWLTTQLAFSFTVAPFILLSIHRSMLAWARVYFYCIIGVTACSVFLLTPGKTWLARKVKARASRPTEGLKRAESYESMQGATLGVPSEPGREWDELVDEVVEEVKRRKGSAAVSDGVELRKKIEETLRSKVNGQKEGTGKE